MRPVDVLIAGYITFASALIVARGMAAHPDGASLLVMYALAGVLLYAFTLLRPHNRVGNLVHDIYPLLLLMPFYTGLGILALQNGISETFARDAVVQRWESVVFGGQVSYEWIRSTPSPFWSGVLHLAYLCYFPIVVIGPILLLARGQAEKGRSVLFSTMIAYVVCYVVFTFFPVAGPNYAFAHPAGAVREVWSARLVYGLLGTGSSFGTAFPSSHVAASVSAVVALWLVWRKLALALLVPTILLVVGTVYCQMHYGIDALSGLAVGLAAGWTGVVLARRRRERLFLQDRPGSATGTDRSVN